jgi:NAD(P)-dependent dehydrogenase (short-subunit alcohol dehydrogenase family)
MFRDRRSRSSGARVREDRALQPDEPFLLTKLVVPHMVKIAGSGVIVNISSGASQTGGRRARCRTARPKAGLDQMTHMLGAEFAPEVRVNSIVVGQIDTPGASSVITEELKQRAARTSDAAAWDRAATSPLARSTRFAGVVVGAPAARSP